GFLPLPSRDRISERVARIGFSIGIRKARLGSVATDDTLPVHDRGTALNGLLASSPANTNELTDEND
ncbi:MAG TPA: hypothetical protein PLR25_28955, partial [Planctomycetaceae bacterium]|nr:hypothetical protein [Planctomycetaceae bacterium]